MAPPIQAQRDLSPWVRPVYEGGESTALSIFDTSPESPDGTYLMFVRYPAIVQGGHAGPEVMAEVMVKNRKSGALKKITEAQVTNHNGSNAFWVGDTLLASMVAHQKTFEVFNVVTGKSLFGKIEGELGHKAAGKYIFFSRCNGRRMARHPEREPYRKKEEGLWRLDVSDGTLKQLISKKKIIKAFVKQNPEITGNEVNLLHVDPNLRGDKILFDYRHKKTPESKRHEQLQGFVNADGSGARWVPKRPMHVVWYDNASMLGVDVDDPQKKIYRYDLWGKELELLAGKACHLGVSPDRQWYGGEGGYYRPEADGFTRAYLYKKGQAQAVGILSAWANEKITWWWVAHVNPSFSADSQRMYFIRAVEGTDKFEAAVLDLKAAGLLVD